MALHPELLELLVCPKSKGELELVALPAAVCELLADRYRGHFEDEEPVVGEGLWCRESGLVYPIVNDVPVMLIAEALAAGDVLPDPIE